MCVTGQGDNAVFAENGATEVIADQPKVGKFRSKRAGSPGDKGPAGGAGEPGQIGLQGDKGVNGRHLKSHVNYNFKRSNSNI